MFCAFAQTHFLQQLCTAEIWNLNRRSETHELQELRKSGLVMRLQNFFGGEMDCQTVLNHLLEHVLHFCYNYSSPK